MFDLTFFLENVGFLKKLPFIRNLAYRYLKSRNPLKISDITFQTKYSYSYALISEKNSNRFQKIMMRLECYIGAGPRALGMV